jgi:hypothetical protein
MYEELTLPRLLKQVEQVFDEFPDGRTGNNLSNYLKTHFFGPESRNHLKTRIGATMAIGSQTGGSDGPTQTSAAYFVGSSG